MVVIADGGAAGDHKKIGCAALHRVRDGLGIVRRDAEIDRLAAPGANGGLERGTVGVMDLAGTGLAGPAGELVAGRQHPDPWPAHDLNGGMTGGRDEADIARRYGPAGVEAGIVQPEAPALCADMLAEHGRRAEQDAAVIRRRVLLDDDAVGARRDRRAGEKPHTGAGLQNRDRRGARFALAQKGQGDAGVRNVEGPHRITVHRRDIEGRRENASLSLRAATRPRASSRLTVSVRSSGRLAMMRARASSTSRSPGFARNSGSTSSTGQLQLGYRS